MTDREKDIMRALMRFYKETSDIAERIEEAIDAAADAIAHVALQNLEDMLEEETD